MSKIKNVPKVTDNEKANLQRDAFELRAKWLYFLLDEARRAGADWKKIGYEAIRRCGLTQGEDFHKILSEISLAGFEKEFVDPEGNAIHTFEAERVKVSDDEFEVHFTYCPLLAAWQKLGCSDEEMAVLCDIAMNGDRGMASTFEEFDFQLGKTLAQGHSCCELIFKRRK